MVKVIFFDIDGTLVSLKTHRMPESTHFALQRLREKGIKIVICSGRPMCLIDNLEGEAFDGYITVNGAICQIGDDIVYRHALPQPEVQNWINYSHGNNVDGCMITLDKVFINRVSPAAVQFFEILNFPLPPVKDFRELSDTPIFQIVGLISKEQEKHAKTAMPGCTFKRWHPLFTDIIMGENNKSLGMRSMLKHMGIDRSDCMAFGDGNNDVEMLDYAGIGVAMGNSDDDVHAHADYVTTDCEDDGILNALKHFKIL